MGIGVIDEYELIQIFYNVENRCRGIMQNTFSRAS